MPRGGARDGAGRPAKKRTTETVSIKAALGIPERLRAAAVALDVTHAEVLEMGVEAAEAKVEQKRTAKLGVSVGTGKKKRAK